jgi:mannose-6-phosphate isomerase
MFEHGLERTNEETAHRYHLIGAETTPCFQIKKSVIKGIAKREENTFFTGVVTAGSCVLKTEEVAIELDTFDKFFCPAGLEAYIIEADEEVQILECFPPA